MILKSYDDQALSVVKYIYYVERNISIHKFIFELKKTSQLGLQTTGYRKGIVRYSTSVKLEKLNFVAFCFWWEMSWE